jgi:hypothetical protein
MESRFHTQGPLPSARSPNEPEPSDPGSPSGSTSDRLHATWLHFREGSGNARKAKAAVRALEESEERLLSLHSYPPDLPHHASAPMSARTLFSRHAAPFSLPELDKYISSLPVPAFASHSRTTAGTKGGRFVPLDRLASTGRSIKSLETNYKRKPAWRNCSVILGGLVNIVLGITVGGLRSTFFSAGRVLGV